MDQHLADQHAEPPEPYIGRTLYALHADVVCGMTQTVPEGVAGSERQALALAYAMEPQQVRMLTQVHGTTVVQADAPTEGMQGDAMIAIADNVLLAVRVADCCPILVYDPPTHAIAAIHSGWRGTAGNIVGATLRAMTDAYGSTPSTMLVLVGPCASGDRYVVRTDVASHFPMDVKPIGDDQFLFSNRDAVSRQLLNAGILPAHIIHDPSCTIADTRYHSYRRDGQRAGRSLAYIGHIQQ